MQLSVLSIDELVKGMVWVEGWVYYQDYQLFVTLLIQLAREVLHLSGKSQGKVMEFQKPLALATMLEWLQPLFSLTVVLFFPLFLFSCKRLVNAWCGRRSLYVLRRLEYTKNSVIDINVWIYTYIYI